MVRTTDIHSLTDFQRNAKTYIQQVRQSKNPMAITVNGKAEVVVQDAAEYQRMVDQLELAGLVVALREGEEDIAAGRTESADDVIANLRTEFGLPG